MAADCQFSFDESWEYYPISASIDSKPLHKALKIIFRNINNAVIFGADRTIKIIIYDDGKTIRHSATTNSSQEPILQIQPFSEATAPQPEVIDPEDSSDAENVDQPSEETDESASGSDEADVETSGSDEADAETTETEEEESDETTAEENTDDLETEQADATTEPESNQAEETESTSGQSDNSENTESAEESNQNQGS